MRPGRAGEGARAARTSAWGPKIERLQAAAKHAARSAAAARLASEANLTFHCIQHVMTMDYVHAVGVVNN